MPPPIRSTKKDGPTRMPSRAHPQDPRCSTDKHRLRFSVVVRCLTEILSQRPRPTIMRLPQQLGRALLGRPCTRVIRFKRLNELRRWNTRKRSAASNPNKTCKQPAATKHQVSALKAHKLCLASKRFLLSASERS